MKNLIILAAVFFSFDSFALEKGVYSCTQVDMNTANPVSVLVKVTHEMKEKIGERAASVFSVTGLAINKKAGLVNFDFPESIELENDIAQFFRPGSNGQSSLEFSLELNDSKSLLTLKYEDVQLENAWVSCRLSY